MKHSVFHRMWNEINPLTPTGISHAAGVFHARRAFHKSRKVFISLKRTHTCRRQMGFFSGRGDGIWTRDLCVPNAALYQTEPHLVINFFFKFCKAAANCLSAATQLTLAVPKIACSLECRAILTAAPQSHPLFPPQAAVVLCATKLSHTSLSVFYYLKACKKPRLYGRGFLAAELGFEPRQTESESVVLPLHNSALFCAVFLTTMILYHF